MNEPFFVHSLEKVFADTRPDGALSRFSLLKNERYSFQLVIPCAGESTVCRIKKPALADGVVELFAVRTVPVTAPAQEKCRDDFLLRGGAPGAYPDVLEPCGDTAAFSGAGFHALWITLRPDGAFAPGERTLTFEIGLPSGVYTAAVTANVIDMELDDGNLICTHWFHSDCLADRYGVQVFSEAYWHIVEKYVRCAVEHGVNMILTPLFTPPLDTEVGAERPTVQLVDVDRDGDAWRFGFDRLDRWIDMCLSCGVEYFEMSHLFTQWGAKRAPKIVSAGKVIFGWETAADSAAYRAFLTALADALRAYLNEKGVADRCFFHVSDEPSLGDLQSYESASTFLRDRFAGFRFIDALSEYAFYEMGLTPTPIPCIDAIDAFAGKTPELWTYYCCGPAGDGYVNRFIYYPSVRNRALGAALYKYNCRGFLHWGYNFWFTALSKASVDPYADTASGGAFPAGDGFVVYPGADGSPAPSLRLKVFYDALTDLRALRTLERLAGRDAALRLVADITFRQYPTDAGDFIRLRERINAEISGNL